MSVKPPMLALRVLTADEIEAEVGAKPHLFPKAGAVGVNAAVLQYPGDAMLCCLQRGIGGPGLITFATLVVPQTVLQAAEGDEVSKRRGPAVRRGRAAAGGHDPATRPDRCRREYSRENNRMPRAWLEPSTGDLEERWTTYQDTQNVAIGFSKAGIPPIAAWWLAVGGYRDLDAVRRASDADLLRLKGLGPGYVKAIRDRLKTNGPIAARPPGDSVLLVQVSLADLDILIDWAQRRAARGREAPSVDLHQRLWNQRAKFLQAYLDGPTPTAKGETDDREAGP